MSPSERVTRALHRIEDFVGRGGHREFVRKLLAYPEAVVVDRWEYDEATDTLYTACYREGHPMDDEPRLVEERVVVDQAIRNHLLRDADDLLRALEIVAMESPQDVAPLAGRIATRLDGIRGAWGRCPESQRRTSPEQVLRALSRRIRALPTAERGGKKAPGEGHRLGNPNWRPKLSQEDQDTLCRRVQELLDSNPATYAPRRPGQVSENLKMQVADEFGISESTAGRYIRKCS